MNSYSAAVCGLTRARGRLSLTVRSYILVADYEATQYQFSNNF